jgi:hypothetical protein
MTCSVRIMNGETKSFLGASSYRKPAMTERFWSLSKRAARKGFFAA